MLTLPDAHRKQKARRAYGRQMSTEGRTDCGETSSMQTCRHVETPARVFTTAGVDIGKKKRESVLQPERSFDKRIMKRNNILQPLNIYYRLGLSLGPHG